MPQVISYLRVSTDKQGNSGLGIEAQREAVARFIAAEGCEAVGEYVEVETGKGADALDRRPSLPPPWPPPARRRRPSWWRSWTGYPVMCISSPA
jgi:Resolvase, N terminal domain